MKKNNSNFRELKLYLNLRNAIDKKLVDVYGMNYTLLALIDMLQEQFIDDKYIYKYTNKIRKRLEC